MHVAHCPDKYKRLTVHSAIALAIIMGILLAGPSRAEAKEVPRFELGPLFSMAQTVSASSTWWRDYIAGYGGRLTANLNPNLALEFQAASFPDIHTNGSSIRGSGHLKATLRLEHSSKVNFFVVAGPGFSKDEDVCCGGNLTAYRVTRFAFDVGGGIELVPVRRLAIRFDATDFMVRVTSTMAGSDFIHNADLKFAVMLRF